MSEIKEYYDEQYDEWARLGRHRIEFDITKRYLDEFLAGENLKIIDIGGGPGRYSIYLSQKGHQVTLVDLSKRNIEVAKAKTCEVGITLDDYIVADVLEYSHPDKFDCVLLMGPLYHLLTDEKRRLAVEKSLSLLKPGGIIVAAFISNYAPMMDYLRNLYPIESPESMLKYLNNGENSAGEGFTTAYFSSYTEAQSLMNSFELTQLAFAGVENVLSYKENELMALEESEYKKWLEIGYTLSQDFNVIGTSHHFLYIGKKI